MPPFGPISRRDLIRCLKQFGFSGPHAGTKHGIMIRGQVRVRLPNPHGGDVGRGLLAKILRQAGISKDEWEKV